MSGAVRDDGMGKNMNTSGSHMGAAINREAKREK